MLRTFKRINELKLSSFVSVIGYCASIFLSLILLFQALNWFLVDKFQNVENIYRLHTTYVFPGQKPINTVRTAGNLAHELKHNFPDSIKAATRFFQFDVVLDKGAMTEVKSKALVVDDTFTDVFELEFLAQSEDEPLADFDSVIVSYEFAKKYFNTTNIIGKHIKICCLANENRSYKVTGVLKPELFGSHLDRSLIVRLKDTDFHPNDQTLNSWINVNLFTYFKLVNEASPSKLENEINSWLTNSGNPVLKTLEQRLSVTSQELIGVVEFSLMDVQDIYLKARQQAGTIGDLKEMGDTVEFWILLGGALAIILLASLNNVLLFVSELPKIHTEFLLRKTLGATFGCGFKEVYMHFIVQIVPSIVLAFPLIMFATDDSFFDAQNNLNNILSVYTLEAFLLLLLFILVIPALMSSMVWWLVMKNSEMLSITADTSGFRKIWHAWPRTLAMLQYTFCFSLLYVSTYMYSDMILGSDLDFLSDEDIVVYTSGVDLPEEINNAEGEGTAKILAASSGPLEDWEHSRIYSLLDKISIISNQSKQVINYLEVNCEFILSINVKGFDCRKDKDAVVLNSSARKLLGFRNADEAIGQILLSSDEMGATERHQIVGVVPDFVYHNLMSHRKPLVIEFKSNQLLPIKIIKGDKKVLERAAFLLSNNKNLSLSYSSVGNLVERSLSEARKLTWTLLLVGLIVLFVAASSLLTVSISSSNEQKNQVMVSRINGAENLTLFAKLFGRLASPLLIGAVVALVPSVIAVIELCDRYSRGIDFYNVLFSLMVSFLAVFLITLVLTIPPIYQLLVSPLKLK